MFLHRLYNPQKSSTLLDSFQFLFIGYFIHSLVPSKYKSSSASLLSLSPINYNTNLCVCMSICGHIVCKKISGSQPFFFNLQHTNVQVGKNAGDLVHQPPSGERRTTHRASVPQNTLTEILWTTTLKYWMLVSTQYPVIALETVNILLCFSTAYFVSWAFWH